MKPITAAVLSGGKALRYGGTAKGLIEVAPGVTILERMLGEIAAAGAEEVIILANDLGPYRSFGLPIVPDLRRGLGPIAGIEAGLAHYAGRSDAVLFLTCDLPGITSEEIRRLLFEFGGNRSGVVYAVSGPGFEQPLCCVVQTDMLAPVRRLIDEGKRKVKDIWRELGAVPLRFDDPEPFFNVNTPEDMKRWSESK